MKQANLDVIEQIKFPQFEQITDTFFVIANEALRGRNHVFGYQRHSNIQFLTRGEDFSTVTHMQPHICDILRT